MPAECVGFDGKLPPVGARISYILGVDPQNLLPRAEAVQPEGCEESVFFPNCSMGTTEGTLSSACDLGTGMIKVNNGTFGFIAQDSGEADMFVMPAQCTGFGGVCPPTGTRVVYSVGIDTKTGRPRAEDVLPGSALEHVEMEMPLAESFPTSKPCVHDSGLVVQRGSRYGFLHQGADKATTRSVNKPSIRPILPMKEIKTGIMKVKSGDIFVTPSEYVGSPPTHTRTSHATGQDRTLRLENARAELQPTSAASSMPAIGGLGLETTHLRSSRQACLSHNMRFPVVCTGEIKLNNETFGFIHQDSGEADMFVMPGQCQIFAGILPPVGTRVMYVVGVDLKTGRPRAEGVMPEDTLGNMLPGVAACGQQFGRRQAGSIKQNNGNYAFIAQDNGEADMFAMPYQCTGFDGALPPVGARVVYNVGVDQKSGRPRAEDVWPEEVLQKKGRSRSHPYTHPYLK